jgi:DNA-binding MarR family transcriptional regulator
VELKADGAAVVLPPSNHVKGVYRVLSAAPLAPAWVLALALKPELKVIEGLGNPALPTASKFELPERISEGARNWTLYRYGCSLRAHGWDHTHILDELRRVNEQRCVNEHGRNVPLSDDEVRKIARSAARHAPGNASMVAPEVLEVIASLEKKAQSRSKKGIAAYSRWAVYRAFLDCAKYHGRMHQGRDVAVRISVRRLALDSGLSKSTTQDALHTLRASGLVYRPSRGNGPVPGTLALRVPDTYKVGTFAPPPQPPPTVPTSSVSEALYRLRHGPGRIGKAAAAVLEEVVECAGASRKELAAKLGKEPDSLSRALKRLVDRGLIERRSRGRYRPVEGWEHVLEQERTLIGEKLAERLDEQQYERERAVHRKYLAEKKNGGDQPDRQTRDTEETAGPDRRLTPEQQERVKRLVYEGMSRTWATAEVLGVGLEE